MVSYTISDVSLNDKLKVLILIVVDDGLVHELRCYTHKDILGVLILIVVDDGLVLSDIATFNAKGELS